MKKRFFGVILAALLFAGPLCAQGFGTFGKPGFNVGNVPALNLNFLEGGLPPGITFTRASTATYFDSSGVRQIAGTNVPRIDHEPVTGAPRGLLIEGGATNHFDNSGSPVTQTSGTLSLGTYTLWMEGTGSIAVAGNTATITGAGTATDGSPVTFTVTTGGTVNYTVSGSPTLAQSEDNVAPTSYIPTAGSQVTRAEDIAKIADISMFNQMAGTVFAEWEAATPLGVGSERVWEISSDPNNSMALHGTGAAGVFRARGFTSGVGIYDFTGFTSTINVIQRSAFRYEASNFAVSIDGGAVPPGGAGAVPSFDDVSLGNRKSGGRSLNGWLREFRYYHDALNDQFLISEGG